MAIGRWLPPFAGHALAGLVTGVLHRRKHSHVYRILYANQAGVLGPAATPAQVDAATAAVLRHAGVTAYDLMHIVAQGEEAIRQAMAFPPEFWADLEAARATGRGVVICGCHLSNFNLGFLAFALHDVPVQVLSAAHPAGGFQIMHEMRARGLLDETPIDSVALRKAIQRLRGGGLAATGADWPIGVPEEQRLTFFGRPARLPTGHVRLALAAGAVLLPIACRWSPGRGYHMIGVPHIALERTGDREADVQHNARRVLAVMERWIAETPDQWLMYHPIWE